MIAAIASGAAGSIRRLDPVLLTIGGVLALLALLVPAQASASLIFTLQSLLRIAPYLLLAVGIAAWIEASGADRLLARAFAGRLSTMILVAALFGALSPFCSCGVVPIVAALLAIGMPLPAVMAFWLASPVMDPQMFVLTVAGIGLGFTIAKTVAAIAIGALGGFATWGLLRLGAFDQPLRGVISACGARRLRQDEPIVWAFWHDADRRMRFLDSTRRNVWFLGRWMALAFLLESLMLAWLPGEVVGRWLGAEGVFAIPLAAFIGAPAYLNGYAAIPTTAALLELGMSPGAALAFMVAGAVTSIPAAVAVYALVRPRVFAWYLFLAFAGATAVGYAYQSVLWL